MMKRPIRGKNSVVDTIGETRSRAIFDSAPLGYRDYSLNGVETEQAFKKGLANAEWYKPEIGRQTLRRLMKRDDYHAIRDTIILFTIIGLSASLSYRAYSSGNWFSFVFFFLVYCTFYTSSGDSRWHECGHGTAFKTRWMNDVMYQIASFMVFREPRVWCFSHARHHTDTDIVGRDPEADARPLDMYNLVLAFFNVQGIKGESIKLFDHARGIMRAREKAFVPRNEYNTVFLNARVWLSIYIVTIAASIALRTPLPAMYVFLPYTLGAWHFVLVGVFQHASLEQDVLDHRLNTRSCYINPISAFIYWNMHFHVEHHMFPMIPYYALPELHEILKPYLPKPYNSMWEVYKEMIPALIKQTKPHKVGENGAVIQGPMYFTDKRDQLPQENHVSGSSSSCNSNKKQNDYPGKHIPLQPDGQGWVQVCSTDYVPVDEVDRFDVGNETFCLFHAADDGKFYATAGLCTHGKAHLEAGLVTDNLIECPKHNGCFDFKTGLPKRLPVRAKLKTYPVKVDKNKVYVCVGNQMEIKYEEDEA